MSLGGFDLLQGLIIHEDMGGKGDAVVGERPEMNIMDSHHLRDRSGFPGRGP